MRRFPGKIPEGHLRGYIFEPPPQTSFALLGVRADELIPQATPKVVDTPRSESTDSDKITRIPRSIKRRTEEHFPRYTTAPGNGNQNEGEPANKGDEITANVNIDVDGT